MKWRETENEGRELLWSREKGEDATVPAMMALRASGAVARKEKHHRHRLGGAKIATNKNTSMLFLILTPETKPHPSSQGENAEQGAGNVQAPGSCISELVEGRAGPTHDRFYAEGSETGPGSLLWVA